MQELGVVVADAVRGRAGFSSVQGGPGSTGEIVARPVASWHGFLPGVACRDRQ